MRTLLPLVVLAACSGSKPPGTESGDTGAAGVCDGFLDSTTAAAVPATSTPPDPCPNGGTPDDLVAYGTMVDPSGPCVVCGATDLTARITVSNGCAVDVTYDGYCGIQEYTVSNGSEGVGMINECTLVSSTLADDVTVPAYGEVVFEALVPGLSEGAWTGTFELAGLDPVETRFCVDVP